MSLILPDKFKTFTIVSVDPGINHTGISVYTLSGNSILSINGYTLHTDKLINQTGIIEEIHGERVIKLSKLSMVFSTILYRENPSIVVCESPFYNSLRPSAYGSLVETIAMFRSTVLNYNTEIPFQLLEPRLIKKLVGSDALKGKGNMKESIGSIKEIMDNLIVDYGSLDEHTIDAIAIGYSFIKLNRESPHV